MAPAAPKLHSDRLKRETLPYSSKRKKGFQVTPPERPLLVARVTGILIDRSIQAPGIRTEFTRDREKGKRKCVGQTNSGKQRSPQQGRERDAHPKNTSANE